MMADISGFRYHMRWTSKQTLPNDVPKLLKLLATLPGTEVSKGLDFFFKSSPKLFSTLYPNPATSQSWSNCVGNRGRLWTGWQSYWQGGVEVRGSNHRQVLNDNILFCKFFSFLWCFVSLFSYKYFLGACCSSSFLFPWSTRQDGSTLQMSSSWCLRELKNLWDRLKKEDIYVFESCYALRWVMFIIK